MPKRGRRLPVSVLRLRREAEDRQLALLQAVDRRGRRDEILVYGADGTLLASLHASDLSADTIACLVRDMQAMTARMHEAVAPLQDIVDGIRRCLPPSSSPPPSR